MRGFLKCTAFAALTLLCSCLKSKEYEYSPQAAITAFSLGDFTVWYNDITWHGTDTIVAKKEPAGLYPFTIDQLNNRIYNVDSLPQGTDARKLTATISAVGSVYHTKKLSDGLTYDTLWSSTDTTDLSSPLTLKVIAPDGSWARNYVVTVNVRKVNPDSVIWHKSSAAGFPAMTAITAIPVADSIMAFGTVDGKPGVMACSNTSAAWTPFNILAGVPDGADMGNVSYFGGQFYLTEGGNLYSSADGRTWTAAAAGTQLARLIPFNQTGSATAWAVTAAGNIASSTDMLTWTEIQPVSAGFPASDVTGMAYPLKSNPGIVRSVIMGNPGAGEAATVWTKLSTEEKWTKIEPSSDRNMSCPALESLAAVRYDGDIYALGGNGISGGKTLKPYNGFWQSADDGLTWRDCASDFDEYSSWNYLMFVPEGLRGISASVFDMTVDTKGRIWLITDKGIWKGGINRLAK